jgi:hypothetical protein
MDVDGLMKKIDGLVKIVNASDPKLEQLSQAPSFAARVRLAITMFPRLTSGSARVIFDYNPGYVLKLAKNEKGIAQNSTEADGFLQQNYDHLITKVIDEDPENKWLVVEKATRASQADFMRTFGTTRDNLCAYLKMKLQYGKPIEKQEWFDKLNDNETAQDILEMMVNYGMPPGDFCRQNSWGVVNGRLVLVDYGLTESILHEHYGR